MNSMKKQKDMTLEDEPFRLEVSKGRVENNYYIAPGRKKQLGQSRNDTQLWVCLVVKLKSNATKSNIA